MGLLIYSSLASRREKQASARMAQTLRLMPVKPEEALLTQISALYQTAGNTPRHSLHNVTRRQLPDGEHFLFDLVDRDTESD